MAPAHTTIEIISGLRRPPRIPHQVTEHSQESPLGQHQPYSEEEEDPLHLSSSEEAPPQEFAAPSRGQEDGDGNDSFDWNQIIEGPPHAEEFAEEADRLEPEELYWDCARRLREEDGSQDGHIIGPFFPGADHHGAWVVPAAEAKEGLPGEHVERGYSEHDEDYGFFFRFGPSWYRCDGYDTARRLWLGLRQQEWLREQAARQGLL